MTDARAPLFRSVSEADAVFDVGTDDGASLPVYRLNGPERAGSLLFGHANGMAAGSYGPWLKLLARGVSVFAFDARGHGGSHWPEGPLEDVFSVDRMAGDLAIVARAVQSQIGGGPLAYAGHSLGGASALRLAAKGGAGLFRALVIFEPPVCPPPGARSYAEAIEKQTRLVTGTLKRRVHWPSIEAFRERLEGRGLYRRFDPAMLAAHCRATLRPAPVGYDLCCPPAVESWIYKSHAEADTWSLLPRIGAPVDLIGGDPDVPDNDWVSSALAEMAAVIPNVRFTRVPGAGHQLIAEKPELCAEMLLERIRK